jgi:hypothetical protein
MFSRRRLIQGAVGTALGGEALARLRTFLENEGDRHLLHSSEA